jgi:hypothetical protein
MLTRLIGSESTAAKLKHALGESNRVVRGIAHRVANAATPERPGFADALDAASAARATEEVDLEREMVALADEQLRFEAASSLLHKVYQQIKSSIRE